MKIDGVTICWEQDLYALHREIQALQAQLCLAESLLELEQLEVYFQRLRENHV